MKHNILKKALSLFLILCIAASLAACKDTGDAHSGPDGTEMPSTTETQVNTTLPASSPTTATEAPSEPPMEATEDTIPAETETEPLEPDSPAVTFVEANETVYAISTVNVRSGPSSDDAIIGSMSYGQSTQRTGIGSNGWSRVIYGGEEAYVYSSYLSTTNPAQDTSGYPKTYSDATCSITITKEWYENAWCYIAHLQFTDYSRFGTACANGAYDNGYETTSHAASRLDAIFAVNGCYSAPYKALGNSVAIPCVDYIVNGMATILRNAA